jgi:hypothetical protein
LNAASDRSAYVKAALGGRFSFGVYMTVLAKIDSKTTDEQIVAAGLELAREFYKSHGNEVPEGFKFYESRHPMEQGMWNLACIAFELLTATDLQSALDNVEE